MKMLLYKLLDSKVTYFPNSCQYENNLKDTCGSTPLMDALRFGNIDIADYLIKEHKVVHNFVLK